MPATTRRQRHAEEHTAGRPFDLQSRVGADEDQLTVDQVDDVEHAEGEMEADRDEDEYRGQNDHVEGVDREECRRPSDRQPLLEDAAVVEVAHIP